MELYVFGDTGGHADQLFSALSSIGVDVENGIIPDGISIVHCGDLIHKGKFSKKLVNRVDKLIRNNPGQWHQILGNHEFQHIEGAPYFWRCDCDYADIEKIENWFEEGLATATYAIPTATSIELSIKKTVEPVDLSKGVFFSHAGITKRWYEKYIRDNGLVEGSKLINDLPVYILNTFGEMMSQPTNRMAGPVWASSVTEVFGSWDTQTGMYQNMDFVQFHGHTTPFIWTRKMWYPGNSLTHKNFRNHTKVDIPHRCTVTSIAGGTIIAVDPGFGARADVEQQPYVKLTI